MCINRVSGVRRRILVNSSSSSSIDSFDVFQAAMDIVKQDVGEFKSTRG